MKRFIMLATGLTVAALQAPTPVSAQAATAEPPAQAQHYRVYTGDGTAASLADVVEAMAEAEVVMVGETHTDPIGHWVEAELLRAAIEVGTRGSRPVALSLEMFERDVQGVVDEYLAGLITEDQFRASARPWPWYQEDYRPLVELAKEADISVIAANAPRRYVNMVSRMGPESLTLLSPEALRTLPPLPFPGPSDAYRAEWMSLMSNMTMADMCPSTESEEAAEAHAAAGVDIGGSGAGTTVGGSGAGSGAAPPPAHAPPAEQPMHGGSFMENGLQAQALWDAAMAHSITEFIRANAGALVIHMVGGFHVQNGTGIPEKVELYRPGTRAVVVHMETAGDITSFDREEHGGRGDFVVLTDAALDLNNQRNCGG